MSKTCYVMTMTAHPAGGKQNSETFCATDLRAGLDAAVAKAEKLVPGLGKAIGQNLRPIVEGGGAAALKENVPHVSAAKVPGGVGDLKVVGHPLVG